MDLSFRFDRARAQALPASVDIAMLLAGLSAEQASGATAVSAARLCATRAAIVMDPRRAIVSLFNGACEESCARALGGSFHPRIAAAMAGKAGSTLMKAGFTTAF